MRNKVAKKLRKFVEAERKDVAVVLYDNETVKTVLENINGTMVPMPRITRTLMEGCQRSIYQKMKKAYKTK